MPGEFTITQTIVSEPRTISFIKIQDAPNPALPNTPARVTEVILILTKGPDGQRRGQKLIEFDKAVGFVASNMTAEEVDKWEAMFRD